MSTLQLIRDAIESEQETNINGATFDSDDIMTMLALPAVTITPNLNLRSRPSLSANIIEPMPLNSELSVFSRDSVLIDGHEWVNVQYGIMIGWCAEKYIKYIPDKFDETEKLINVPYVSQEGIGASRFRNDCGAACISMLLRYYLKLFISVDQLASNTSLISHDNGLRTDQLQTLAKKFGLTLTLDNNLTVDKIKQHVDDDEPVLMLIQYSYILDRQNITDRAQHFVIVVGYTEDEIIVHDPDFWGARATEGQNFRIPTWQFVDSINHAVPHTQGLY